MSIKSFLVIGCGAREYAIVKSLTKDSNALICCIGNYYNAGLARICNNYQVINLNHHSRIKEFCSKNNLKLSEIAYVGDDINCFDLLSNVGVSACPKNAVQKVMSINGIIKLNSKGGEGAFREFAELYLQ